MRGRSPHAVASDGRRLLPAALTAVLLLSGLAYATTRLTGQSRSARHTRHAHRRSFALVVVPGGATVRSGASTRLRVLVYQRGYRTPVRLRVSGGLPAGARIVPLPIAPSRSSRWIRGSLAVTTSPATALGTYHIRVTAVRPRRAGLTGRRHVSATLRLTVRGSVATAARSAFVVRGDAPAPLAPGVSVPLDVSLQNPNAFAIVVRAVGVGVAAVSTPHADPAHPCAASDFATTPLAPSSGIVVPARATVRLSALGVDPSRWPHLTMLERLADQDGCKGAALRLSYTGAATKAPG